MNDAYVVSFNTTTYSKNPYFKSSETSKVGYIIHVHICNPLESMYTIPKTYQFKGHSFMKGKKDWNQTIVWVLSKWYASICQ